MSALSLPKSIASLASTALFGLAFATLVPGPASASDTVFHPLAFGQPTVRFDGEMDQTGHAFYLTQAMLQQPLAFQVALTSAISVMPEASWMRVQINGHPLQPIPLGTDRATTRHQRIVSPTMLQPGWNSVQLAVDQRHRVDCTFPATFELWTDLNAASTGFLSTGIPLANMHANSTVEHLVGAPRNSEGRTVLHGVLSNGADDRATQALGDALATLALALGVQSPQTSLSHSQVGDGINVRLDATGEVAPGFYRLDESHGTLQVTLGGSTAEQWARASAALSTDLEPYQNERAAAGHRLVNGADRFTLADLGLPSQEFSGRHFEQSFTLELPADYFASDVGRAEIRLAGGYVEGLADHAELSVQVNEKLVASIRLDGSQSEVFSGRSLYVDLGHFRPGRNEVAIVADVTHTDDAACDSAALTDVTPRFLLLDETQISFPKFARLGQVPRLAPGLGHTLTGRDGVTHIYVPHPDVQTLSAATALRVQLAIDAGRADGVEIVFNAPSDANTLHRSDNNIIIAAFDDLPDQMAQAVNLPVNELTLAWAAPDLFAPNLQDDAILTASTTAPAAGPSQQPLPPALNMAVPDQTWSTWSDNPVAQRLAVLRQELAQPLSSDVSTTASIGTVAPLQALPLAPRFPSATNSDDLRARWEQSVSDTSAIVRSASELGQRLQTYIVGLMGEPEHTPDISANADLVIQQMAHSPWSDEPLTLITASEPARLQAAVQALSQPRHWQQLSGSRAVFSQAEQRLDVSRGLAEARYVVTQPTSISNWRLVFAGYYSNNPLLYTFVILMIAPAIGVVLGRAIHCSGQGQEQNEATDQDGAHA
ncbi:MAG: cellulose biosynthesis cyclic di-GMP-binding regulatory protein BcsB [Pseudomonadota bacterium]